MFCINLFFTILNMSIASSVIAILLLSIRYLFKKLIIPKKFYHVMWWVLAFRLTVPISITSVFSIFNFATRQSSAVTPVKDNVAQIQFIDGAPQLENVIYSNTAFSVFLKIFFVVWVVVATVMMAIFIFSFFVAKHKLQTAFIIKHNAIFEECKEALNLKRRVKLFKSSEIDCAIVFGVFNPKIIVSDKLDLSDTENMRHILTHEMVHIKRWDYILKIIARVTLIFHWFNPIIWICYKLFEKDMEVSCDELALNVLGLENKSSYASSILNLASKQHNFVYGNIIGFGELTIKARVKSIVKYKSLSIGKNIAIIIFIVFIGIITTTNPVVSSNEFYLPQAKSISKQATSALEQTTKALVKALSPLDIKEVSRIASIDPSVADISINSLKNSQYLFKGYKIFPQTDKLAYCYLYFEGGECLVGVLELDNKENEFVLSKLYTIETFESIKILERNNIENDGVELVKNLHRFGIVDPFNDVDKIPKPAIAAFCIDDVYNDLVKQSKISADETYIEQDYIEQDAKRYFNMDGFSYTFDEELFDSNAQKYIYKKDRGNGINADIVNVKIDGNNTVATAQIYLDKLHTKVDKTVIYTLIKDR